MIPFTMHSQILVNCYIDEIYWFARNGSGAKTPSQPLFKKIIFSLLLYFKAEILKHVEHGDIVHHQFTNNYGGDVFKNYASSSSCLKTTKQIARN